LTLEAHLGFELPSPKKQNPRNRKKTKTKQKMCAASPEESCRVCLSTIETDDQQQPEAARSQKTPD